MRLYQTAWLAGGGLALSCLAAPLDAAQGPRSGAPAPARPPQTAAPSTRRNAPVARPVTLRLRQTPLRTAIQMLFRGTGLQHAVEPTVPNYPITLDIRGIPFKTALRTVMRLAPGVTYRKMGEVYVIGLRQPAPVVTQNTYQPPAPVEPLAASEQRWEKISLQYIHPLVLAAVLGGHVVPREDQVTPGLGGYGAGYGGYGSGGYGSLGGGGLGQAGYGSYGSGGSGLNGAYNSSARSNLILPRGRGTSRARSRR